MKSTLPAVSLVVLNWNGREHLAACLESLSNLDYPRERLELIFCDNGSTDGSVSYVKSSFPAFRVLELDRNYGFAIANDRAAEVAGGEWVGFLNNDMWVPPGWLHELLAPLQTQPETACLASRIMNWDGSEIDFIGGGVNFQGHGLQLDHGATRSPHDRMRRVLFACGGAMLIRRQVFLDAGGFDPLYFSHFGDLDLGWRLNLLGHDVWYTPGATVLHKHHATMKRFPPYQMRMLSERNALFTIFKNYDDQNLNAVLPAALLLLNEKVLRMSGVDRSSFMLNAMRELSESESPSSAPPVNPETAARKVARVVRQEGLRSLLNKVAQRREMLIPPVLRRRPPLPELAASHLVAVGEFARSLPELKSKRDWIQQRRKRSDEEVLGLEKVLLHDPSYGDPGYLQFQRWLCGVSGIDERFKKVKL